MTQYPRMRQTLDEWGVPASNRLEWDCGHFGVTLRSMRTEEFRDFLMGAARSHPHVPQSESGPLDVTSP
jgi:hypothetical protein